MRPSFVLKLCPLLFGTALSATAVEGPLLPPSDKKLLFIGQDLDSISAYTSNTGHIPTGLTGYISISDLSGLNTLVNNDAGDNNMAQLHQDYPNSALAIGVYLVGELDAINQGTLDQNLQTLAQTLKDWNRPVFLRWGYEFDGIWNTYEPNAFIQAWQRMHQVLSNIQANNVAMVWQGATYCGGSYLSQGIEEWYPGDQYVDWMGLSYFTPQDCNNGALSPMVSLARSRNKPLMIAESAPQRYDTTELTYNSSLQRTTSDVVKTGPQIWNEWFANYFAFIESNSDVIKAVAYINADWDSQPMWAAPYENGYWGDTRIQGNTDIRSRWLAEVTGDQWLTPSSDLLDRLHTSASPQGPNTTSPPSSPETTRVVIEAENSTLTGSATVYSDTAASGNAGVAYISNTGAGFIINDAPSATSVELHYASAFSGSITLSVNDVKHPITFETTGAWTGTYNTTSIALPINQGDTVALAFNNGDTAVNIDQLTFLSSQPASPGQGSDTGGNAGTGSTNGDGSTTTGGTATGGTTGDNTSAGSHTDEEPVDTASCTDLGVLAQNQSFQWTLEGTGNDRVEVTSNSASNSQLIELTYGTHNTTNAIDSGMRLPLQWQGITGSTSLTLTAQSDSVSIGEVIFNGAPLSCPQGTGNTPTSPTNDSDSNSGSNNGQSDNGQNGNGQSDNGNNGNNGNNGSNDNGTIVTPLIPTNGDIKSYISTTEIINDVVITRRAERYRVRHELSHSDFNNFNIEYWRARFGAFEMRDYTRDSATSERLQNCGTTDPCVVVILSSAVPMSMIDVFGNTKDCNQQVPNWRFSKVYGDETNFEYGYVMDLVLDNGDIVPACSASASQRAQATRWRAVMKPDQNLSIPFNYGTQIEFETTINFDQAQLTGDNVNYYGQTFRYILGEGFTTNNQDPAAGLTGINDAYSSLGGDTTIPQLSPTGGEQQRLAYMQHAYNIGGNHIESWLRGRRLFHTDFNDGHHVEQLLPGPQASNGNLNFPEMAGKTTQAIQNSCIDCHFANGSGERQTTQAVIPPRMLGMGLLDAIPDATIKSWARMNGGRVNYVNFEGVTRVGKYGWDANTATVKHQIVDALKSDMGVGTSVNGFGPQEIDDETLNDLVVYASLTAIPSPRANLTEHPGHQRFQEFGCNQCHIMEVQTGESEFSELSDQTIHPYTDLLLHDLGEGEFRTAPLWGVGLSSYVRTGNQDSFQLMHDGTSHTFDAAIQRHRGKGNNARNAYLQASPSARKAIIDYLHAL
ncbi:di-heme oxidoredictase family protein [Marinibactrum halimedae]|uniref:Carbohydrate-binding protein n=1 Tax=Marinibactrum halimedae TaxID=1444977 RepID=A0AA37T6S8_9GAMM|nr:di-heme oxidoredictase family protein [Marinibactrum halimedae]MCD9457628.1 hypothetical protein [Marinibactrum halimedae]GLS28050.1 hypothetical protein GCM10007877_37690 [Marinibactrum halimedae]